jgi:tetratricopeptide (TPR) repeat protein
MTDHCFISYSNADGLDFARKLVNELEGGHSYIATWFDKDDLNPAEDWDEQIADAIKSCKCLLFVMTEDSVTPNSVCKQEWTYALRYKKPVVPIRLDLNIEVPFSLGSRQWIDFSSNFDSGIAKLRQYLERLDSPEGLRLELKSRLSDAHRDLKRAKTKEEELRIQTEIDALNTSLRHQELIVKNPQKAERQTKRNIDDGIQLERKSKQLIPIQTKVKFINPLPFNPPDYFQGRELEIRQLADFIKSDHQRILTIVGRAGGGKTALACYFLKAMEKGYFPHDLGEAKADGIVYLSEIGSHKVNIPNIYTDLLQFLSEDTANRLDTLYRQPKVPIGEKIRLLLENFQKDPVILLLDNFELFVDTETGHLIDYELKELLNAILLAPQHSIKVIITTRVPARDIAIVEPIRNIPLHLDEGLKSPYAENILRAMDGDGHAGFRDASEQQVGKARELTRGFPRALESLFAIISVDRYTSIDELLSLELPDTVVESLVGEAFSRLDANSQKVMQALAVYDRPVPPSAIDYLLQFHIPGINSSLILARLVSMHFARREAGRFYLHPTDREYAFSRIPNKEGDKNIGRGARSRVWNKRSLLLRAADFYFEARKLQNETRKLEDLNAQLSEFDLRCVAEDYDSAAKVLREIDFVNLFLWGHYNLMIELHSRVKNKLRVPNLAMGHLNAWASAHSSLGNINEAINLYQDGLRIAQDSKDRGYEKTFLMNLGGAYYSVSDPNRPMEYINRAMMIGEYIDSAYTVSIDNGLLNLGLCYAALGEPTTALEMYEKYESNNDFVSRPTKLANMGQAYFDLGNNDQAIKYLLEAIQICDQVGFQYGQNWTRWLLAQVYLFNKDLNQAFEIISDAERYNTPQNNFNSATLLGIITLLQNRLDLSTKAFERAIAQANELLIKAPEYYDALYSQGISFCGKALIEDQHYIGEAEKAFRLAGKITRARGVVKRNLRLFDEISKVDANNILVNMQSVIEGTE